LGILIIGDFDHAPFFDAKKSVDLYIFSAPIVGMSLGQ
jgi:hypothetical protein